MNCGCSATSSCVSERATSLETGRFRLAPQFRRQIDLAIGRDATSAALLVRAAFLAAAERVRRPWCVPPCALPRSAVRRCGSTRRCRACRDSALRETVLLRFALERLGHGARHARPPFRLALALTRFVGVFGALACSLRDLAALWRRQVDAGAPRLGKPDGNRLFGRARAMLAMTNFVDLLADELARLGRGRFALALDPGEPSRWFALAAFPSSIDSQPQRQRWRADCSEETRDG